MGISPRGEPVDTIRQKKMKTLVNKQVLQVSNTRSSATFEELKSWKIFHKPSKVVQLENVVAIRVHSKERNKTEEAYYLAKVTGPVEQLQEGGQYEGNWYEKGYFVFKLKWFHYRGTTQVEGMAVGDRHYCLGNAATDNCTMQLNGVVTGVDSFYKFKKVITKKGRDKIFVLAAEDHDKIMTLGNLSS